MLLPMSIDIFPKPIKIPKFVALVFVIQRAIKIENIRTDQPAPTASTPIIAMEVIQVGVDGSKVLAAKKTNPCPVMKSNKSERF